MTKRPPPTGRVAAIVGPGEAVSFPEGVDAARAAAALRDLDRTLAASPDAAARLAAAMDLEALAAERGLTLADAAALVSTLGVDSGDLAARLAAVASLPDHPVAGLARLAAHLHPGALAAALAAQVRAGVTGAADAVRGLTSAGGGLQ